MTTDLEFLSSLGIQPDLLWLIELTTDMTQEQQRYVSNLLRINMLLGGGGEIVIMKDEPSL